MYIGYDSYTMVIARAFIVTSIYLVNFYKLKNQLLFHLLYKC